MRSRNSALRFFHLVLLLFPVLPTAFAQSGNWAQQTPKTSPPARDYQAMAYDSVANHVVMFGGYANSNFTELSDTWEYDGTNWTQQSPQTNPPERFQFAIAYDSTHQQTVIFGGQNPGLLNDTWLWNNTNWTQAKPAANPPGRLGHAMVYDSAHGQVVLFGGQGNAGMVFNDTWVWDGTNWTQKSPQTSPPARNYHVMAYDSAHGQVVLFGGSDTNGNIFNDTWVWDGTNWTQKSPQTSPPSLQFAGMAFDAAHSQVVMFGGVVGSVFTGSSTNQTWLWDGTNWTQQTPSASPPARQGLAMAFDSLHNQVVMFGGYSTNYANDTWTWQGAGGPYVCTNTTAPVITFVDSGSAYGGYPYFASGTWLEIKGTNLADPNDPRIASGTGQWAASDFNGVNAPTVLDGISVSVNGKPAYVWYLSQGQLNVQAPEDSSTGIVPITVTNCKATSSQFMFTRQALAPGLLAPASFNIDGKQYLAATFSSDGAYVLNTGAISGVNSRPAKGGDVIVGYGIGFGDVTPSILPGVIAEQTNLLNNPVTFSFGSVEATLTYSGLAGNFVGLYEFYITVPSGLANGDYEINVTQNGTPAPQTVYLTVQN
jgi:uncharacterized protein (TIGR03437 family)